MEAEEQAAIRADFAAVVNLAPAEIEAFLDTAESKRVGAKGDAGGESVGHRSGRRIVAIRRTKVAELSDADYAHMKKVIGYVRRHLAQGGPDEDAEHSDWRYSLMNWGHDPLKD
jgi:hypothetical protein